MNYGNRIILQFFFQPKERAHGGESEVARKCLSQVGRRIRGNPIGRLQKDCQLEKREELYDQCPIEHPIKCLICLFYRTSATIQPFFVERVFHIFDKDDNGSISLQEFIDAMHQFAGQSPDDKIKFLFKVYDIDGKN